MTTRIPASLIEDLLARIDIVELIDARVSLRKKGNNHTALCPFHSEKTPSFTVSQSKQFYYCFGCGAHGNAIGFLMQYERLDFMDALEALAAKAGITLPQPENFDSDKFNNAAHYYNLLEKVTKIYKAQLKQSALAIDYLKSRGITGVIAKQFALGYALDAWENLTTVLGETDSAKEQLSHIGVLIKKNHQQYYDRFRGRVIFPIRDVRGRVIAFGGRTLGTELPKYLNSPETDIFHKGSELYGLYEARQACSPLTRIIIVEGYMDVIALVQLGIPYVAATLGTAITSKHIQKLRRYTSEIIFCFDGDLAGAKAAWRALENTLPIMQDGLKILFMFLPQGEDPDSYIRQQGQKAFLSLIDQALSLSDFFFQQLLQQTDIKTPDGKAKLAALAKNYLEKIPQGIFQQLMMQKLADMIQIDAINLVRPPLENPVSSLQLPDSGRVLSPFKLAITLLLQHPALAQTVTEIDFLKAFNTRDADNLYKLLTLLQKNPQLTIGTLLEHWREQDDVAYLAKLAAYEHPLPAESITVEFEGALVRIHESWREQTIQVLLAKGKQQNLDTAEKLQLQQLLMKKKQ